MLGTVTRAGRLLDLFSTATPEWGATAVARELDVAKSQAHELLTSLHAIGLLRRTPSGRYRLGWRTLELGREVLRSQFSGETVRLVRSLATQFGEPVQLVAVDRGRPTVLVSHPGRRDTDEVLPAYGLERLLHCTAIGKCLLAWTPNTDLKALMATCTWSAPTERTIVGAAQLEAELATIRRRRVAFDRGELSPSLRAVAVPVEDQPGHVVATLGLWTDAACWQRRGDELTRAVTGAGRRMSASMQDSREGAYFQSTPPGSTP